jgi:hypothetical protein
MSDVRIKARVVIREVLSASTYRATLPNGKRIVAYSRPLDAIPPLSVGDSYHVLLSLCDFNEGRLVPEDLNGIRLSCPIVVGDEG